MGHHVVVDNASACGSCPQRGRGEPLFCQNFRSLGVNGPGGFAVVATLKELSPDGYDVLFGGN